MVGIKGITGLPEPAPERPTNVRDRKPAPSAETAQTKDDVLISNEAQAAAAVMRSMQIAKSEPDIRAERVAAAKQNIERGDYKRPEVVARVAERISKYLP